MVRFIVLTVALALMAGVLAVLLVVTLGGADETQGPTRRYLLTMAWTCLALLLLTLLAMVLLAVHYAVDRLRRLRRAKSTPYVDAWSEAGRRFRLAPDERIDQRETDPDRDADGEDELPS